MHVNLLRQIRFYAFRVVSRCFELFRIVSSRIEQNRGDSRPFVYSPIASYPMYLIILLLNVSERSLIRQNGVYYTPLVFILSPCTLFSRSISQTALDQSRRDQTRENRNGIESDRARKRSIIFHRTPYKQKKVFGPRSCAMDATRLVSIPVHSCQFASIRVYSNRLDQIRIETTRNDSKPLESRPFALFLALSSLIYYTGLYCNRMEYNIIQKHDTLFKVQ